MRISVTVYELLLYGLSEAFAFTDRSSLSFFTSPKSIYRRWWKTNTTTNYEVNNTKNDSYRQIKKTKTQTAKKTKKPNPLNQSTKKNPHKDQAKKPKIKQQKIKPQNTKQKNQTKEDNQRNKQKQLKRKKEHKMFSFIFNVLIFLCLGKEQIKIKSTLCSKLRQRWVKMCFYCVLNVLKEKLEKKWRSD